MSLVDKIRRWARKVPWRYSPVGQAFHWVMAALVLLQLGLGWWIGRLPAGPGKLEGYQRHSALGLFLLVLLLLRMGWRLMVPGPKNDADKPGWQSTTAHVTHYVFYAALLALPLSGWAMWSAMAAELPLSVGGLWSWPQLPLQDLPEPVRWRIMRWASNTHFALVVTLLVLIPAHAGAALKHHFWDREDVLAAMVPAMDPPEEEDPPETPNRPPAGPFPGPSAPG